MIKLIPLFSVLFAFAVPSVSFSQVSWADTQTMRFCSSKLSTYEAAAPEAVCTLELESVERFTPVAQQYEDISSATHENQQTIKEIPIYSGRMNPIAATGHIFFTHLQVLDYCGQKNGLLTDIDGVLYYLASTVGDYQRVINIECE